MKTTAFLTASSTYNHRVRLRLGSDPRRVVLGQVPHQGREAPLAEWRTFLQTDIRKEHECISPWAVARSSCFPLFKWRQWANDKPTQVRSDMTCEWSESCVQSSLVDALFGFIVKSYLISLLSTEHKQRFDPLKSDNSWWLCVRSLPDLLLYLTFWGLITERFSSHDSQSVCR